MDKLDKILSPEQKQAFDKYYEMLVEKNQVMNLTAITEYEEVQLKHFYDSLTIDKVLDMKKISSMIDVGTGAGFPGIPLKIMYPHLQLTLLDSLNKRITWLKEVVEALGLENVKCIHGRAEEFGTNPEYREQYDLVVSRAVANLSTLSEYCMPFAKVDGYFVSYKAATAEEELQNAKKAIKILGGELEEKEQFYLDDVDMERTLLKFRKKNSTPKKYPRKAGLPSKEPLG